MNVTAPAYSHIFPLKAASNRRTLHHSHGSCNTPSCLESPHRQRVFYQRRGSHPRNDDPTDSDPRLAFRSTLSLLSLNGLPSLDVFRTLDWTRVSREI